MQPAWAVTQTVTNLADSADSISELVVTGADSITLTGTNTYTGSTTVNGGNLIIPQGGSAKNT
ncbi:autotransporter-associated beta strand repeat-containing protein, partial [Pseudomonas coronafaciens]